MPCPGRKRASAAGLISDGAASDPVDGGLTVKLALRLTPLKAAVIVTAVLAVTDRVVTPKVALVAPAATVTVAGTVATLVLLLVSVTTAPPDGAARVRLTVPWELFPPATVVGLSAIEASDAGCVVGRA